MKYSKNHFNEQYMVSPVSCEKETYSASETKKGLKCVETSVLFDEYCSFTPLSLQEQHEVIIDPTTFECRIKDRVICFTSTLIITYTPDEVSTGDTISFRASENEWVKQAYVSGVEITKLGLVKIRVTIKPRFITSVIDELL